MTLLVGSLEEARALDAADPLTPMREQFHLPLHSPTGQPTIYLCGNSLGLQPRRTAAYVQEELDDWARLGVEGHFHARRPWYDYHTFLTARMAAIVGALPHEVIVMGSLTGNLHAMMASFYRPSAKRYRLVIEGGAFPSDRYAAHSQAMLHGLDPDDAVVELVPRAGEDCLRPEDVLSKLDELGDSLALVMLGGVHYYTGQAHDMAAITRRAHALGARVGFDLAHAVGNLRLRLHDDGPDFAVWCSYKYLNAGPGGVAGLFVHDRHKDDLSIPRQAGWWGNDPATRFEMAKRFIPQPGAAGWQVSNAPVLPMAALLASLEVFEEAGGMEALSERGLRLHRYARALLDALPGQPVHIITPSQPGQHGCQLSLRFMRDGRAVFERLQAAGVICDWRNPDVIRIAPAPLYNTFEDVWRFVDITRQTLG
jgi:kynureninase